jgi:DNA-binding Lrp family transcriptional regulator
VIKRRIALLDPLKVGLGLTAIVPVQVGDHSGKAIARFAAEIAAMEEVMECYRMRATSITTCVSLCPMPRPSKFFTRV